MSQGEMMRPRAGHGWTGIIVGGKFIGLIQTDAGQWITTGHARGWPRCSRCRRPFERPVITSQTICPTCYFYKVLSVEEFWRLHNEGHPLAPYNVGRKVMRNLHQLSSLRDDHFKHWRRALRPKSQSC